MPLGVLVTQCIQRDFVDVLGDEQPVPGPLHVGHREARRLLGDDPSDGPMATFMRWAHEQPDDRLRIVHIRDHHDAQDPSQRAHLARFGDHCLRGSRGAELVAGVEALVARPSVRLVDAIGLNDFEGKTGESLRAALDEARGDSPDGALRVGVIGVWTDAKVTFLLYDLHSRAHVMQLGTCSALTASASRAQHLNALDQLERLLDVRVEHSIGAFASWLIGERIDAGAVERDRALRTPGSLVRLSYDGTPPASLADPSSDDSTLVAYLFRECRSASLKPLSGGFSGAIVLIAESEDAFGHRQAPSVVKLGPRRDIGYERVSLERVESVLGNAAPSVIEFADRNERGAVRFRYASMSSSDVGKVSSFQKLYASGVEQGEVDRILEAALGDALGRLYAAATLEPIDILKEYEFDPKWAPSIEKHVASLTSAAQATQNTLEIKGFGRTSNVARFYDTTLPNLEGARGARHPVSFVHGDLNGQNVIVDGRGNVWIIDFGRLRRGHALRDFAKLENDVLYVMTKIDGATCEQARAMVDALIDRDVAMPLGDPPASVRDAALVRAWSTIAKVRALAKPIAEQADANGYRVALLRFAAHTLSFDEPTIEQRRWALWACGGLCARFTPSARSG